MDHETLKHNWKFLPTGYFTHELVRLNTASGIPETPERVDAIENRLFFSFGEVISIRNAKPAALEIISLAHDKTYINELKEASLGNTDLIKKIAREDAPIGPQTFDAALLSAGATIDAVDAIFARTIKNAFCGVRPPGHHAGKSHAAGFCYFNNAAIGAIYAAKKYNLNKVVILDFDAHHGDGTEEIVANREDIVYASLFQWPLYPAKKMEPTPRNVFISPLNAGAGSSEWRDVVENTWLPLLAQYEPELIILSSGFDAHREEELAQLTVSESDYAYITRRILEAATELCSGRVISVLEGGYSIRALARSALTHVEMLVRAGYC